MSMEFNYEIFKQIIGALADNGVTEVHIVTGAPPFIRQGGARALAPLELPGEDDETGETVLMNFKTMKPAEVREFAVDVISSAYMHTEDASPEIDKMDAGEVDVTRSIPHASRYRAHICKQRGSLAVSIRIVPKEIPSKESIPEELLNSSVYSSGLVLISGMPRSGKSSTVAGVLDKINHSQCKKIVSLESPVEYLHRHDKSLVVQHEVGTDTSDFFAGLKMVLHEDPDIVIIDGAKDTESIQTALDFAESGMLVILTSFGNNIAESIGRILARIPDEKQNQVREQLSSVLRVASCQQLIPYIKDDTPKLIPIFEVLKTVSPELRDAIREGNVHDIAKAARKDTDTMLQALSKLRKDGLISDEDWNARKNLLSEE